MEVLMTVNQYISYPYILIGIIIAVLLIVLLIRTLKLTKEVNVKVVRVGNLFNQIIIKINDAQTAFTRSMEELKQALLIVMFVHFFRKSYKKNPKHSVVKSAAGAAGKVGMKMLRS